jgi:ankyrin repeat protein
VEAIKVLMAHGADVNAKEKWKQQTALMLAVARRQYGAGTLLLEAGRPLEDRSMFGWTPLSFAARQGQIDTIKLLLGAGRHQRDAARRHQRPRHRMQGLNYETAQVLIEAWHRSQRLGTGLDGAPSDRLVARPQRGQNNPGQKPQGNVSSLELAKALVQHGADINARQTKEPLVDMEGRNSLNRFGATPFFLAAKSVDVPLMQTLLDLGADPFSGNIDGDTPLDGGRGCRRLLAGREPG